MKKLIYLTILLLVGKVCAQNNAIATVAPFLNIVTDARSAGMGDVGVATSADANALFHNASKMVFSEEKIAMTANYTPWLRALTNDIYITNLAFQSKINKRSAFALGVKYFNFGDVELTQIGIDLATTVNPYELAVEGAYALQLSDSFSMGVGLRYFRSDLSVNSEESNELSPVNGFAVDISGYFQSKEIPLNSFNGRFRGGIHISNIGPKVSYVSGRENFIPTNFRLGLGFDFVFDSYNSLAVTGEVSKLLVPTIGGENQNFLDGILNSFNDAPEGLNEEFQEIVFGGGLEYDYNQKLKLRGGYLYENPVKGNRNFFTTGLGLQASDFTIDVSYLINISSVNNPLENTLRFSLTFEI